MEEFERLSEKDDMIRSSPERGPSVDDAGRVARGVARGVARHGRPVSADAAGVKGFQQGGFFASITSLNARVA
jgi:hypothetical protein